MTDDEYADALAAAAHPDPEMRAALATLLDDEPASPPLVDDVARGRLALRRRRTRAGAVAGLAAVLVAVLGATALIRPAAPAAPAAPAGQGPSPAAEMADRLAPALASMGWTVTGAELVTTAQRSEIRLSLASAADPGVTPQLWVLGSDPDERLTSSYYDACTETSCPGTRQMSIADGVTATSGFEERGALSGSLVPPGAGARIMDREYGTGSLVELVSVPGRDVGPTWTPRPGPSPEAAEPPGGLSFDQLSRLLTLVGDPLRTTPQPTPVVDAPACRDSDVKLTPAPASDTGLDRQALAVEVDARNPEVRCTLVGWPAVRVVGTDGEALPTAYNQAVVATEPGAVLVTQAASPAARAILTWSVCRSTPGIAGASLRVTLPGDDVPITVELPQGLGPTACAGVDAVTLDVQPFTATGTTIPDPGPTAPAPTTQPTSSAAPTVLSGLRGVAATSAACPALPDAEVPADVRITGEVTRLWVCATATVEPFPVRRGPATEVAPGDGELFTTLLRELERADERTPVAACAAYYQTPRSVVVETPDGYWLAHLPHDECDHFSGALRDALGRASR